jgi:hypothetical protein
VLIKFDTTYSTCETQVIYGKEGGNRMVHRSKIRQRNVEIQSVSVSAMRCSLKDGNVFVEGLICVG